MTKIGNFVPKLAVNSHFTLPYTPLESRYLLTPAVMLNVFKILGGINAKVSTSGGFFIDPPRASLLITIPECETGDELKDNQALLFYDNFF